MVARTNQGQWTRKTHKEMARYYKAMSSDEKKNVTGWLRKQWRVTGWGEKKGRQRVIRKTIKDKTKMRK